MLHLNTSDDAETSGDVQGESYVICWTASTGLLWC